jgi:hypothetical protein
MNWKSIIIVIDSSEGIFWRGTAKFVAMGREQR